MRKIHVLGLALIAMFALSAVVASTAFAETESKFLLNAKPIETEPEANAEGTITLLNTKTLIGTVEAKNCSGVIMGHILPEPAANHILIVSVLNLTEEPLTELGASPELGVPCESGTNCNTPTAWPDNLPWLAQIVLMPGAASEWLLHLTEDEEEPKGQPAWDIQCTGGLKLSGLCAGLVSFLLTNGVSDVLSEITQGELELEKEVGTCTSGGEGFVETTTGLINSPQGTLSLS